MRLSLSRAGVPLTFLGIGMAPLLEPNVWKGYEVAGVGLPHNVILKVLDYRRVYRRVHTRKDMSTSSITTVEH